MTLRAAAALAGILVLVSSASAQGLSSRRGGIPGRTLSTTPGVGGVGVPGQVPGGTLSTQSGIGSVGGGGQAPGGTIGQALQCGVVRCQPMLLLPGLIVLVPVPVPVDGASDAPADDVPTSARE